MRKHDYQYNVAFASKLLDAVPADAKAALQLYMHESRWNWSSACSGTDCPAFCYHAMKQAALDRGWDVHVEHHISAELDPEKRRWIKEAVVPSPRVLLQDMFHAASDTPQMNDMTGRVAVVPLCQGCWFIGFSCKGASGLNPQRDGQHLSKDNTTTGVTWRGVLAIALRHKPRFFLLENVLGVLAGDQLPVMRKDLRSRGYALFYWKTSPIQHGFPQDRHRVWFLAVLLSDIESAGVDEATLEAEITRTVDALSHAKECVGVDEILLPEHHPIVFARRREQMKMQQTCRSSAMSADMEQTCGISKWVDIQERMYRKTWATARGQSRWHAALAEKHPG